MSIVRTHTGKNLDLANPNSKEICIEDIAHHLAKLDRYNGAGHYSYSVGQHSLLVADALPKEYKLQGLLHDATEAYLGDVVSPLKAMLPEYRRIEGQVMRAICNRFQITFPRPQIIKKADQAVMAAEMQQVVKWPVGPASGFAAVSAGYGDQAHGMAAGQRTISGTFSGTGERARPERWVGIVRLHNDAPGRYDPPRINT
ncbi:hypothetical protein [Pseudodesulfovibrio senegalensis]|uniref:Phosphohydrolase n=1 Tax=Pseudodesulfovibrio senegalensis TaxID=1721087 RepID=A0A6N6MZI4_9BACT|nr:hypothetical protein [Pseudodesulfovibrio senegalensis]KAB1440348.1 hypothetical protein F8A88_13950 [Pseudodesulfovibrio senegalensis]